MATTADEFRPIEAGIVVSTPSFPAVWAVNQIRVVEALSHEELIELADRELAGCEYRQIAVEHQKTGAEVEKAFRAARWKVERDVLMILDGPPDREADTSVVEDTGEDEMLELMRRWYESDEPTPDEAEQLVEFGRREVRTLGDRLLGVRSGDGRLVAITKLRSDGSTAQVEDVYTVPEARGRGFARALVSRAVELARDGGNDMTFIVADDEGWPKLLYGRLGFRSVGLLWHFHRD
ncbi:MAG: GNAT family N-acetyltransferase [Pseudonocardia sp.]|nr:GNAT family N-acetyltransferase [Pseudonocardia sp.]